MTRVVFAGGGGHASVLLDIVRALGTLEVVGYLAPVPGVLSAAGVEYLGDDGRVGAMRERGIEHAALGLAGARDNAQRVRVFVHWKRHGMRFVTLIHPSAVVSSRASTSEGLQCFPNAVINAGSVLGANVIVNTGAIVEHDCVIEDHAHVAPRAVLAGGATIGARSLIGVGATVLPGIAIGSDVLVAAGSVVTRPVPSGERVGGVPARQLRASARLEDV
jgi:sugar O-acyltransferase (sialic acid O-acetyltransferase NeuD family)